MAKPRWVTAIQDLWTLQIYVQRGTAKMGRLLSDGTTDPDLNADLPAPFVWIRLNGSREETRAINIRVADNVPDLEVRVGKPRKGDWEVIEVDAQRAMVTWGAATATLNTVRRIGALIQEVVRGRNLEPGRCYAMSGMIVNVGEFPYTDSAGNRKRWVPFTTNGVDISTSIPTASSDTPPINRLRHVQMALNPDATSPALVALDGTPKYMQQYIQGEGDYLNIDIPGGYIPLDACFLMTGDVTMHAASEIEGSTSSASPWYSVTSSSW